MFQGRYIANFIELARLEMLKKSGELSVLRKKERKKERKKDTFPRSKSANFRVP